MKTFHNGSYALCDVASHNAGMCSDISTIAIERQADRSIMPGGGGPRIGRTRPGGTRGEKSAADYGAGFLPPRFSLFALAARIFCFGETSLRKLRC